MREVVYSRKKCATIIDVSQRKLVSVSRKVGMETSDSTQSSAKRAALGRAAES